VSALLLVVALAWCAPASAADPSPSSAVPDADASPPLVDDAAWIAYQTDRGGEGVWLIHPDGTGDHQVGAEFDGSFQLPDWSPDGTRLVMTSRDTGGTEPLFVYDLATDAYHQLFACDDPCLGDDEPAWSPDGTRVAFIRALGPFVHSDVLDDDVPADCGLWVGDVASGVVEQLTSNEACDREVAPRWSPDGSTIAYFRERVADGAVTDAIFTIDAAGGAERQLTDWGLAAGYPDWSPDGQWIVYATHPLYSFNFDDVPSDLYRMRVDGSDAEALTAAGSGSLRANQPRVTPDGTRVMFTLVRPGSREIWSIPADGGEPTAITGSGIYTHPTLQPIP
jgi:Tol biopolymer transport system component